MFYTLSKIIIGITWALIIANQLISIPEPFAISLYWIGLFFIVAHIIEIFVFSPRVKYTKGQAWVHYLLLFIFGACHGLQLPKTDPRLIH